MRIFDSHARMLCILVYDNICVCNANMSTSMKDFQSFIHKICACGTNLECALLKQATGMVKNMLDRIYRFIEKNNMIASQDTVIVGVSGGADSVCLLTILKELQKSIDFSIIVVHINHCIRGYESDMDQEFVRQLCEKYEVEFKAFAVDIHKKAEQEKISVEEAGRKARYQIFEEVLSESVNGSSGKIAVAHHMDDQGETILMNVLRGSGMKGACGMQPVRGNVIRPLLCVRRREIELYLQLKRQAFRIDSTNLENDYTRNRLRNVVFPYLEENVNTHSIENICGMAQMVSEAELFIDRQAIAAKSKCVSINEDNMHTINIPLFSENDIIIKKYIIKKIIGELAGKLKDVYKIHIESILELENKKVGSQVDVAYGIFAKRGYNEIMIQEKSNQEKYIYKKEPEDIVIEEKSIVSIKDRYYVKEEGLVIFDKAELCKLYEFEEIIGNDYTKVFDYDKIKFNIRFRTRQTGDYIQIDENGGNKKLKDFFIDNKVPKDYRDRVLLLADGNCILWIVGFRMSEGYKVSSKTQKFLQIKIY